MKGSLIVLFIIIVILLTVVFMFRCHRFYHRWKSAIVTQHPVRVEESCTRERRQKKRTTGDQTVRTGAVVVERVPPDYDRAEIITHAQPMGISVPPPPYTPPQDDVKCQY